jgi:hypothetical protein
LELGLCREVPLGRIPGGRELLPLSLIHYLNVFYFFAVVSDPVEVVAAAYQASFIYVVVCGVFSDVPSHVEVSAGVESSHERSGDSCPAEQQNREGYACFGAERGFR